MPLLAEYHNKEIKGKELLERLKTLNNTGHGIPLSTLKTYVKQIKEEAGGGSRNTNFDQFIKNDLAMYLVGQYNGQQNKDISTHEQLLTEVNKIEGLKKISKRTLIRYLKEIKKAGIGAPNLQASASASGNPGSSIPIEEGSRNNISFELFKSNAEAMSLVAQLEDEIGFKMCERTLAEYLRKMKKEAQQNPGASSHYGGALPSQQAPPMDETFVPLPSQAETDSTNWFEENSQNNDGDLQSMVNPPSSWKRALGFLSSLVGASPQEPQFSPSMHDTSAASSYYPSNQPDDETLQSLITPRNPSSSKKAPGLSSHYGGTMPSQQAPPMYGTDVPSQAGIDSTNWFEENLQNDEGSLQSLVNPKNTSSWKSAWGSASNYCGAIPFQQAPMSGTLFPAFSNQPSNQSAPLNPSTNSVSSQPGTPSLDWSEGNSQNDDGSLYSVVRPKRPSSSKASLCKANISRQKAKRPKSDAKAMARTALYLPFKYESQPCDKESEGNARQLLGLAISETTLTRYLMDIEEEAQQNPAGFESQSTEVDFSNPAPQFIQAPQIAQQSSNFTSGNPGSSTSASNRGKSTNSGGGSRKITFKRFKNDPRAMDLVEQFNNKQITDTALSEALEQINHKMSTKAMYLYLNMLNEEKKAGSGAPNFQDTQIAGQSYNFTSDNPGSSSHYGGIVPSQQAPPMDGTLVPSQAGTHSWWSGENSQNDDGSLESMITPRNQKGSSSHYGGAMPFQQAPMSGTSSFLAFPNQPSNQSAPLNPSTNFVPSQPGTPSLDWSEGNSQNDEGDLYSVVRPKRPSSSKGKSATKTGKKPRK
uniref:Uncharacterized protein n=1 Tax=Globodera rostochiensis TaxID=31243 RepID=A0A914GT36_GLORO